MRSLTLRLSSWRITKTDETTTFCFDRKISPPFELCSILREKTHRRASGVGGDGGGVNAREVATELGVTERTVRRWVSAGRLDAQKEGGRFVIDLDAARGAYSRSRPGRSTEGSIKLAELRGRYLEVCARLAQAENQLVQERLRADRFEAILYPPEDLRAALEPPEGMEVG
jgi:excisionase family DNA binding protein